MYIVQKKIIYYSYYINNILVVNSASVATVVFRVGYVGSRGENLLCTHWTMNISISSFRPTGHSPATCDWTQQSMKIHITVSSTNQMRSHKPTRDHNTAWLQIRLIKPPRCVPLTRLSFPCEQGLLLPLASLWELDNLLRAKWTSFVYRFFQFAWRPPSPMMITSFTFL